MSRVEALLPVVSVVNIIIMSVVPASYDMMMDVSQLVLRIMLASRVFFSLRESDQDESDKRHCRYRHFVQLSTTNTLHLIDYLHSSSALPPLAVHSRTVPYDAILT